MQKHEKNIISDNEKKSDFYLILSIVSNIIKIVLKTFES